MTPVDSNDSRGDRFYVFELDADENPVERIHESDLTAAQRELVGLPPLPVPSPQATEEVGPDV